MTCATETNPISSRFMQVFNKFGISVHTILCTTFCHVKRDDHSSYLLKCLKYADRHRVETQQKLIPTAFLVN